MVDSINPAGQSQVVQNTRKTQDAQKTSENEQTGNAPVDEVRISEEALSLSQAEEAARSVGSALEKSPSATLSADQQRLSTLA